MITIIAYYTNKRIANIDTSIILNEKFKTFIIGMKDKAVDEIEIYAYIGLLVLFGLSNKVV